MSHPAPKTAIGEFGWYVARKQGADVDKLCGAAGSLVLLGKAGLERGRRLRNGGWEGRLRLDPGQHEVPSATDWAAVQRELEVAELISPGGLVTVDDPASLERVVESQRAWVGDHGGRMSVALERKLLGTAEVSLVLDALADAGVPVMITLEDANDPLGYVGAVDGFRQLIHGLDDVAVQRIDLGGIGALAHGARFAGIGIAGSSRHYVREGKGGGGSGVVSPSVVVRDLVGYFQAFLLQRWSTHPKGKIPCLYEPCSGQSLDRFVFEQYADEVLAHNMHTVEGMVEELNGETEVLDRQTWWAQLCRDAEVRRRELSRVTSEDVRVDYQLRGWAGT